MFKFIASLFSVSDLPPGIVLLFDNGGRYVWSAAADITAWESAKFAELLALSSRGARPVWSNWSPLKRHLMPF